MNRKLLLWIVGVVVLAALSLVAGWQEIRTAISRANPLVLAGLLVLQALTFVVIAYQWRYLFGRADVAVSYRQVLEVTLTGGFVESVTPSSKLGGMAAKVYLFERTTDAEYGTIGSVLLAQKYVSMLPFALIGIGSLLAASVGLELAITLTVEATTVVTAVTVLVLVALALEWYRRRAGASDPGRRGRLARTLERGRATCRSLVSEAGSLLDRRSRWWLYGVSTVLWGIYPLKIYVVAITLGVEVSLTLAVIGTYLAYVVGLAPISPGGTGTFEGTLALVFVAGGATFAEGLSVALLGRVVTFWFPLVLSALVTIVLIHDDDDVLPDGILGRLLSRLRVSRR